MDSAVTARHSETHSRIAGGTYASPLRAETWQAVHFWLVPRSNDLRRAAQLLVQLVGHMCRIPIAQERAYVYLRDPLAV